jgi:hypothetical protein
MSYAPICYHDAELKTQGDTGAFLSLQTITSSSWPFTLRSAGKIYSVLQLLIGITGCPGQVRSIKYLGIAS